MSYISKAPARQVSDTMELFPDIVTLKIIFQTYNVMNVAEYPTNELIQYTSKILITRLGDKQMATLRQLTGIFNTSTTLPKKSPKLQFQGWNITRPPIQPHIVYILLHHLQGWNRISNSTSHHQQFSPWHHV